LVHGSRLVQEWMGSRDEELRSLSSYAEAPNRHDGISNEGVHIELVSRKEAGRVMDKLGILSRGEAI
jgi:hypothetical protein